MGWIYKERRGCVVEEKERGVRGRAGVEIGDLTPTFMGTNIIIKVNKKKFFEKYTC